MEQHDHSYLEDVATHEGGEKARGWDLDREFGIGTKEEILPFLESAARAALDGEDYDRAADSWWVYRVLTGRNLGSPEEQRKMAQTFQDRADGDLTLFSIAMHVVRLRGLTGKHHASTETRQELKELSMSFGTDNQVERRLWKKLFLASQEEGLMQMRDEEMAAMLRERAKEARHLSAEMSEVRFNGAAYMAMCRLARAYAIKFIPGKGIEIIDDPPKEFASQITPLPEQREF